MEVLVFSTSVQSLDQVKILAPGIDSLAGKGHWNFALDDCDKVLRIASENVKAQHAIKLLKENGFDCRELTD